MQDPRRQPGESLREQRDWEVVLPTLHLISFSGGCLSMAIAAWLLSLLNDHWPWYVIGISAAMMLFALWSAHSMPKRASALSRGILGERAVADALSELHAHGYHIFHDLPDTTGEGRPCNIDHVLAGPEGVFVIETKFRSKRPEGKNAVKVTPEAVLLNGRPVEPDPRAQARACADSVRRRLAARLESPPHVQPVVVLPRWWTESGFGAGAWVLNEASLVSALKKARGERLTGAPLNQVVAELDAWSRSRSA